MAKTSSIAPQIEEINRLVIEEQGQNSAKIDWLDRKIEKLGPSIARQKSAAIEPLSRVVLDSRSPLKTRIFCINFLGLIDDPGTFPIFSQVLLDSSQQDALRSAAASLLSHAPVSTGAMRKVLCQNFSQKNLPELTFSQTLFEISKIGCPQADLLLKQAQDFGDNPMGQKKVLAELSVQALGESFSLKAPETLWRLFSFYAPGSRMRREVLKELLNQSRRELPRAYVFLTQARGAVSSESRFPSNEVLALEVLSSLGGKDVISDIQRELKNPSPAVRDVAEKALKKARG